MQSIKLKSELQTNSHAISSASFGAVSSASFGGLTEQGGGGGGRGLGGENRSDNRR